MIGQERYVTELEDALDEVRDAAPGSRLTIAPVVRLDTGEVQGYYVTRGGSAPHGVAVVSRSVTPYQLLALTSGRFALTVGVGRFWLHGRTWRAALPRG